MKALSAMLWLGAAAVCFELGLLFFNSFDLEGMGIALTVIAFPVCLIMSIMDIPAVQKRVDKLFGGDEE